MKITIEELKRRLRYEPDTGNFIWLTHKFPERVGTVAGRVNVQRRYRHDNPYREYQIKLYNKYYTASRLIWFYMTGEWPNGQVDHKDGNSLNNRWDNLRIATGSQNQVNRKLENNRDLPQGVYKNGKKYIARLSYHGNMMNLGTFPTVAEAAAEYRQKSVEIWGEFSPFYKELSVA